MKISLPNFSDTLVLVKSKRKCKVEKSRPCTKFSLRFKVKGLLNFKDLVKMIHF